MKVALCAVVLLGCSIPPGEAPAECLLDDGEYVIRYSEGSTGSCGPVEPQGLFVTGGRVSGDMQALADCDATSEPLCTESLEWTCVTPRGIVVWHQSELRPEGSGAYGLHSVEVAGPGLQCASSYIVRIERQ